MSLAYRGAYKQNQFEKRMDIQHVQKNPILPSKLIIELFGHDAGDLVKFIKWWGSLILFGFMSFMFTVG